jgi:beta-lactam-binding protein with PASTA domain
MSQPGAVRTPPTLIALQCASSCSLTIVGILLGNGTTGKLVASMIGTLIGAFLTAPGRHHARRIVAVGLLLSLIDTAKSLAATLRYGGRGSTGRGAVLSSRGILRRRLDGLVGALPTATAHTVVVTGAVATVGFGAGWAIAKSPLVPPCSSCHQAFVTVPRVDGVTRGVALVRLARAGFSVATALAPSAGVPRGSVISSNPTEGARARYRSRVTLLLSSGRLVSRLEIPQVDRMLRVAAVARLGAAGFRTTVSASPSEAVPKGEVIATDPPAGSRAPKGSTVSVTVSAGPASHLVRVPEVDGQAVSAAERTLAGAGFRSSVTDQPNTTVAAGDVISTNPAAGSSAPKNATVTMFVSSGAAMVVVPAVVGDDAATAASALESAGLQWTVSNQSSPSVQLGSVISTSPAAGASVAPGTTVTMFVSTGPSMVEVPDVDGLSQDAAVAELQAAGFQTNVESEPSTSVPAGDVITTSGTGGSQEPEGSTVTVVVSTGDAG